MVFILFAGDVNRVVIEPVQFAPDGLREVFGGERGIVDETYPFTCIAIAFIGVISWRCSPELVLLSKFLELAVVQVPYLVEVGGCFNVVNHVFLLCGV